MAKQQTTISEENISPSERSAPPATAMATASHGVTGKTERRGSPQPVGKPHRITYDCTKPRYRQLKLASMNTGESMNAIISSAIDEWLAAHPEALDV